MIKKIRVDQLKPGMFIHDLNCGWIHHPFLGGSMKVKNEKTIEKIVEYGIREVYIDTDKGPDVTDAPTMEEVSEKIQSEINEFAEPRVCNKDIVEVKEELVKAREIKKVALRSVKSLMEDIRFGRQVDMNKVNDIVEIMVESILRNKSALTCLNRIKRVDEYTYMHSVSVGALMISFGKCLSLDYGLIKSIGIGGVLHDIGKTRVPPDLLTKSGGLTDDEFRKVKEHVIHSREILKSTADISEISMEVAAFHHERLNGKGYPDNLEEGNISRFAQMAAIADVYDAMTSKRCYQRQFHPTETLKKLYEWNDSYNRELVQHFIKCVGIYPVGSLVRLESGLLGVVIDHGEKSLLYPVVRIIYDTRKKRHLNPYERDLSLKGDDKVAGYEQPEKWDIKPELSL